MKRILSLFLVFGMSLGFCGCVNLKTDDTKVTTQSEVSAADTAKTESSIIDTTTPEKTSASEVTAAPTINISDGITLEDYPVVDGSTATIPLAIGLIHKISGCTSVQAEESIAFNTTDSSYYAMADGLSDLLLVYEPSQPTIDALDVFNTMDMRAIGLDALVFIVNEDNPVNSLTSDQIRGIYSGEIANWSKVGGEDMEIVAFQRPELSGSQTLMLNLMMKGKLMMTPATETISEGMADIIQDISSFDNSANAIGYSVYYYAKNMYTQPGLKFIAVDDVLPSNETINSREYGFTNPFYGVIPLDPKPQAEAILDWLLTKEGQQLLSDCGYVPIMEM